MGIEAYLTLNNNEVIEAFKSVSTASLLGFFRQMKHMWPIGVDSSVSVSKTKE